MNIKQLKNLISNLENEYIVTDEKIKVLESQINILRENSFQNKLMNTIFPMLMYWILLFLLFQFISLPVVVLKMVNILLPPILGFGTGKIVNHKNNSKNNLSKFTKAKTYQEILNEKN